MKTLTKTDSELITDNLHVVDSVVRECIKYNDGMLMVNKGPSVSESIKEGTVRLMEGWIIKEDQP